MSTQFSNFYNLMTSLPEGRLNLLHEGGDIIPNFVDLLGYDESWILLPDSDRYPYADYVIGRSLGNPRLVIFLYSEWSAGWPGHRGQSQIYLENEFGRIYQHVNPAWCIVLSHDFLAIGNEASTRDETEAQIQGYYLEELKEDVAKDIFEKLRFPNQDIDDWRG